MGQRLKRFKQIQELEKSRLTDEGMKNIICLCKEEDELNTQLRFARYMQCETGAKIDAIIVGREAEEQIIKELKKVTHLIDTLVIDHKLN